MNSSILTTIRAQNSEHLQDLIAQAIQSHGPLCSLNHIDVGAIQDFTTLFAIEPHFNGDISRWDTSNALNMTLMFRSCAFNGDISKWNTSKVCNMGGMFKQSRFNGDVSQWNVHLVREMDHMFEETSFNGDLSKWDVSQVWTFKSMFANSPFCGDLSPWKINEDAIFLDMNQGNPMFLPAQSELTPWVLGLFVESGQTPADPLWAQAFADAAPIAKSLGFSQRDHVRAIVATYDNLLGGSSKGLIENNSSVNANLFT